jgi:DNA-binding transcriptional regulator YdaS (Cro superfamily)
MDTQPTPLQAAVDAAGGQAAAARLLGVSPSLVWQWLNDRRPLPPEYCPVLESKTGIRCEALLPGMTWTRNQSGVVTGYHVPLNGEAA